MTSALFTWIFCLQQLLSDNSQLTVHRKNTTTLWIRKCLQANLLSQWRNALLGCRFLSIPAPSGNLASFYDTQTHFKITNPTFLSGHTTYGKPVEAYTSPPAQHIIQNTGAVRGDAHRNLPKWLAQREAGHHSQNASAAGLWQRAYAQTTTTMWAFFKKQTATMQRHTHSPTGMNWSICPAVEETPRRAQSMQRARNITHHLLRRWTLQ